MNQAGRLCLSSITPNQSEKRDGRFLIVRIRNGKAFGPIDLNAASAAFGDGSSISSSHWLADFP